MSCDRLLIWKRLYGLRSAFISITLFEEARGTVGNLGYLEKLTRFGWEMKGDHHGIHNFEKA